MNDELELLLSGLNEQQKEIVQADENLLVTACPGSGKTRVLTCKLAYRVLLHPQSRKKIVAITYTNRAADEIKDRLELLDIEQNSIWAGTIHQFCLEYIIYPYSMFLQRTCKGFKIIDEYVQAQYLTDIIDELNLAMPYYEKAKIRTALDMNMQIVEEKNPHIVERYHQLIMKNKEIDFDLILCLSFQILNTHPIASKNIANMLRCIYVDEYQDTNELQYQIIGMLSKSNPSVEIMFVGDTDQAIYGSLGGVAKKIGEIADITQLHFTHATLNGCYRSTQRIVDYYSEFQKSKYNIVSLSPKADNQGVIALDSSIHKDDIYQAIAEIIKNEIARGVSQDEICVIAPQWYLLYPLSKALRDLLPDVLFDAPDISPIKADEMNVFYKLAKLIFTEPGKRVTRRKRIATEIIKVLSDEYDILLPEHIDCFWLLQRINSVHPDTNSGIRYFAQVTETILSSSGINKSTYPRIYETYEGFLLKTEERMNKYDLSDELEVFRKVFREKVGVVITSCHKIKGEEYNTVITFGVLYGMIPHWDTIFSPILSEEDEAKKMLYVIASRAKESLYLFAEQGRTTKNSVYSLTRILSNYPYQYDFRT